MSVINNVGATPNRVEIVWSYICQTQSNRLRESDLRARLAPAAHQQSGEEGGQGVNHVITEMINLGLIARVGESIEIPDDAPKGNNKALLNYLETNLLDPQKSDTLGQGSFPSALSWFLARDPAIPLDYSYNYNGEIERECGSESNSFQLTSPARFQQFIYWAIYLGFAWLTELSTQSKTLVFPDPTKALVRHIPQVLKRGETQPIQEVVTQVARELPVLDTGISRQQIERILPVEKRCPAGSFSRSTSFALERLEDRKQVQLISLDDAPNMLLDRVTGPRPVSHITWIQEE